MLGHLGGHFPPLMLERARQPVRAARITDTTLEKHSIFMHFCNLSKGSAAGAATVYNLRLPSEGLRQGHGPVAGARNLIVRASPGCRRPLFRRSVACVTKGVCVVPVVARLWKEGG